MSPKNPVAADIAPHKWFWDVLNDYLARQTLKQTRQRKVVVEEFLRVDRHVDAEDLHNIVRKRDPRVGLATVYRTLNLLKEAGLADQKSFRDGRSVFEVHRPDHHHDHLVCLDCGRVMEFENAQIEKLQAQVATELGFQLTGHRLDLYGKCNRKACERKPPVP
ncbi:MAG: hypothetical protein RIQ81_2521 [Pseudomonadota bacterium]|jgi:Fur family ferric uptake transcriptional regulator